MVPTETIRSEELTLGTIETVQFLDIAHLDRHQQTQVAGLVERFVAGGSEDDTDPFDVLGMIETELATISHTEGYTITSESEDAARLFGGLLFGRLSDLERQGQTEEARTLASRSYEALFSSSPNIVSHSGTPDKQFKLLALAQATPMARDLSSPIIGELAYATAFGYPEDIFVAALKDDVPVRQLQALAVLRRISRWAEANGRWAEPAINKASTAFAAVVRDEANSALVRKVAAANEQELRHQWVGLDELPPLERERLLKKHQMTREIQRNAQAELAEKFPVLAAEGVPLVAIARECAATWRDGGLGTIQQRSSAGDVPTTLDVVRGTPELGLSAEQSLLLFELHQTAVRELVQEDLGIELSEVSLSAQVRLLEYMVNAQTDVYKRLGNVLSTAPSADRTELAEAFLALEFGEDFGDILLDVLEANPSEAVAIVGKIREVRNAAEKIGGMFAVDSDDPLDKELARAMPVAFIKRTTELLARAKRDGATVVMPSLEAVQYATQQIADAVQHGSFQVAEAGADYGTLRAANHPVTITFRPNGNNARLGLTVRGMGEDRRQRLSIRLDYEAGRLSLDMGSTAQHDVNSSEIAKQVGSDLAKGELALAALRAERAMAQGIQPEAIVLHGNHVREAFQHIADLQPEEFSGLLHRFLYRLRLSDPTTLQTAARRSER